MSIKFNNRTNTFTVDTGDVNFDDSVTITDGNQFLADNGAVGAPGYAFVGDANTGFYQGSVGSGIVGVSANGTNAMNWASTQVTALQLMGMTDGMYVQGAVNDQGQAGQFAFADVSGGIGRFGSYDYDTTSWQPVILQGADTVDINAISASGIVAIQVNSADRFAIDGANSRTVFNDYPIFIEERGAAGTDVAAYGQLWVRSDTPNTLVFTDDAGTDYDVAGATVGGITGTVANNQVVTGTGSSTVDSSANLTFDTTNLTMPTDGTGIRLESTTDVGLATTTHPFQIGLSSSSNIRMDNNEILCVSNGTAGILNLQTNGGEIDIGAANPAIMRFIGGSDLHLRDAGVLRIFDSTDTDFVDFEHNGTNFVTTATTTDDWIITGITNNVSIRSGTNLDIRDGGGLRIRDTGDTDNVLMTHDGTNFDIAATNTSDFTITGHTRNLVVGDQAALDLQLSSGPWTGVADHAIGLTTTTNDDNIEFHLEVDEGSNNRRARFFLSDESGEFGLQGSASSGVPDFSLYLGGTREMYMPSGGGLFMLENASAQSSSATYGQLWVRNDTANTLMFTDDAGTDFAIAGSTVGSGISGTIANDQVVVGTGSSTVDSSSALTFDGTEFSTTGRLRSTASGTREAGGLQLEAAQASIYFQSTGAGADENNWDMLAFNDGGVGTLRFGTATDADGFGASWLTATRDGSNVNNIQINASSALNITGGADLNLNDNGVLRVRDASDTDWVSFSHDGTDFNIVGTNTTDINIDNISLLNVNVNANSQTSVEIGEPSTLRGDTQNGRLVLYGEQTGAITSATLTNSGTNLQIAGTVPTMQVNVNADIIGGHYFQIRDTGNTDNVRFQHDGTDFNITGTNTTDLNFISGGPSRSIVFNQQVLDHWHGGNQGSDNLRHIHYPVGGSFKIDSPSQTGAIRITLPNTAAIGNMAAYVIRGYDYTSSTGAWQLTLGGYDFNDTPDRWVSTNAHIIGNPPFDVVKFQQDSTTDQFYIQLGETTDSHQYPQVWIESLTVGFTGQSNENLANNWSIALVTNETGITNEFTRYLNNQYGTSTLYQFRSTAGIDYGFMNGADIRAYDTTNNDYLSIRHTGTIGLIDGNVGTIQISPGSSANNVEVITGSDFRVRDGGAVVVFDSTDTDSATFSHDGTDFNTTFSNTTDWNLGSGLSAVRYYSGLASATFDVGRGGNERLSIVVNDGNASLTLDQDETDATAHNMVFNIDSANTGSRDFIFQENGTGRFQINNLSNLVQVRDGYGLRIYDSTDTDYITMSHDGTDANITTVNTTELNIAETGTLVKLPSASDVSLVSTDHPFQIGESNTANLRMDNNEILAVSNGSTGILNLQTNGGEIDIGAATAATMRFVNGSDLHLRDAGVLRIFDSTDTDFVDFSHDGTDFNIAATTTTDINISGITTLAGSFNLGSSVLPYLTATAASANRKVAFTTTTGTASGNFQLNIDSGSGEFTYNPNNNTLTVANILSSGRIQAENGFHGNYDDTATNTWGGPIWGMDDGFTGPIGGANALATSTYGMRWNRSGSSQADAQIGEGVYVYQNGVLEGGIGSAGLRVNNQGTFTGNLTASLIYPGNQSTKYINNVTGQYGSIAVFGETTSYRGYAVGAGDIVLMSNGTTHGIFDDINNDWWVQFSENAGVRLYYNGSQKLTTATNGVSVTGTVTATLGSLVATGTGGDTVSIRHDGSKSIIANLGSASMDLELTSIVEAQVVDSDVAGNTAGFKIKDHGQNLRDAGYNDLYLTENNPASVTVDEANIGGVIYADDNTGFTVTLPSSTSSFPIGGVITIINANTSGNITVSDQSLYTCFYLDGSTRTDIGGSATIGPGGVATIWRQTTGGTAAERTFLMWGSGITP